MHQSSMDLMLSLLASRCFDGATVLDCGAKTHGHQQSYRALVRALGMHYTGTDAEAGRNVDVVSDIYNLNELRGEQFDFVISGQLLEHLERPWEAVEVMKRHVRPGGWLLLIAPFVQEEHKYPLDCWRLLPDGVRAMLRGWEEVEAGIQAPPTKQDYIHDCWGAARRPIN